MADISSIKLNDTTYNIKDETARNNINSISTNLNNYLPLSGGTMTGSLQIKSSAIDSSNTNPPSSNQYFVGLGIYDKSNKYIGYLQAMRNTNGNNYLQIAARRIVNSQNKEASLSLSVDAEGNASCTLPKIISGTWEGSTINVAHGGTGGTDSGWQSYTNSNVFTGTIFYRKVGVFFMIQAQAINLKNTVSAGSYVTLMNVPSAYRPSKEVSPMCFMNTSGVDVRVAPMRLSWNGDLMLYANKNDAIANTYNLYFSGFGFI